MWILRLQILDGTRQSNTHRDPRVRYMSLFIISWIILNNVDNLPFFLLFQIEDAMVEEKGHAKRPHQSYSRDDSKIPPRASDQSKRWVSLQRQRNSYSKQRWSFVSALEIQRKKLYVYICYESCTYKTIYKACYISIYLIINVVYSFYYRQSLIIKLSL